MGRKITSTLSGLLVLFCIFCDIKFLFTCSKVISFNRINDSYDSFLYHKIYCCCVGGGVGVGVGVGVYHYVPVCLCQWVCKFLNFIESLKIHSKDIKIHSKDMFEILYHDRVQYIGKIHISEICLKVSFGA